MFNPYWQACALCACCHELGSYSSPPLSWCAIDGFVLDVFGSGVVRKLGLVTGIAAMWALSIASRLGCGRLTATSVCTSITVVKVGLSAWMYPVADTLVAVKWIYLPGVISFVNFNWQVPYAFSVRWLALWSTTIPFARCIQSQLVAAFTIHVTALILLKGRLDLAWRHIHPRDY